ncbi:Geranylgeranylglyceryl phosphate synthase [uncultured archaeon]|nr:Geranylgeranylglyceryl phosphate synthase [uncultured archaeon]
MNVKIGKTERYIHERLEEKGALFFMDLDPVDYATPDEAIKVGVESAENGADVVLIGGSTGAQGDLLDYVTKGIKDKVHNVPVVLFPGNIATLTRHADAVYFMSLLNARNPYWLIQAHTLSAPIVKGMGIEALPTGYIVVAPGGTVGWVGDANLVPREKPKIAASLALAGEYLGHRLIVTDAGANPQLQGYGHIPLEMIRMVKSTISVPYIVGGGIRTVDEVKSVVKAGADCVQIGTAIEQDKQAKSKVKLFAEAIKEEGAKKLK